MFNVCTRKTMAFGGKDKYMILTLLTITGSFVHYLCIHTRLLFYGKIIFSHEAMTDLVFLLNKLVDKDGKILVDGLYNEVAPLNPTETALYETIDFDVNAYRKDIGCNKLMHNEKKEKILMHRWRFPSLSLHGIEGAFSAPGQKTVIPRKVIGKFSIRIVPNQEPKQIEKYVVDYIQNIWNTRGSPNKMKVRNFDS